MKVVGLIMARNAGKRLQATLDGMAEYCDGVFLLDDRSTDETAQIARNHAIVWNCLRVNPTIGEGEWLFPENRHLNLLYTMAEFEKPDWVLRLDDDESIQPGEKLREVLAAQGEEVSGVCFPKFSLWNDPDYPDMVPLMGRLYRMQGAVWRGYEGVWAQQPLHNLRMPEGVKERGKVVESHEVTFFHSGWNTLSQRIAKAKFYISRDPERRWNHGVAYDRSLLFGYSLSEIDELLAEYRKRRYTAGI
jgi:glycosyltransferase involved in cell wall biosynthesis